MKPEEKKPEDKKDKEKQQSTTAEDASDDGNGATAP